VLFLLFQAGIRSSSDGAFSGLNGSSYWWIDDGSTEIGLAWGSWLTYDAELLYATNFSSIKEGISIRCLLNRN
jgi:hypothetical protein